MGIAGNTFCKKPRGESNGWVLLLEVSEHVVVETPVRVLSAEKISFPLLVPSVVELPSSSTENPENCSESACSACLASFVRSWRKDLIDWGVRVSGRS